MNLFEKAGRDSVTANAKHYAKDVRHLVMLSGFSLAESAPYPQAPLPNVGATTTTVNFASPPGLNPGFQVNPFFDRLLLPVLELIQLSAVQPAQQSVQLPPPQQRAPIPFVEIFHRSTFAFMESNIFILFVYYLLLHYLIT